MTSTILGVIHNETPSYDVIAKKDAYEIRRYNKLYLAQISYEVPLNTEFLSKSGAGFFSLYGYISGYNETQTKMSMVAPVIMQETENDCVIKRTMSFIMSPTKFTSLDQIPIPNDKNIRIVEQTNSFDLACITFNMTMTIEKNAAKEKELREAAYRDRIQLSSNKSDILYFGYNPPYTIPHFKRNEICIPVISQELNPN
ncbi:unnamed protein product [Rotaria sp. Silwood2]|nr:unnamed protein product [Rotaria sp. Silwood2]CAF3122608.1 unnamed protein product [Rotaria sp. Silwood2]CAF3359841.1 unnamed protein product [Rotaria sp. Silwood2]CAF4489659.1 unnamed protein product [Rotaria sp. Silwood2]CAF4504740.1 unnamed protein product [Rotaria sp. Silwood2]